VEKFQNNFLLFFIAKTLKMIPSYYRQIHEAVRAKMFEKMSNFKKIHGNLSIDFYIIVTILSDFLN